MIKRPVVAKLFSLLSLLVFGLNSFSLGDVNNVTKDFLKEFQKPITELESSFRDFKTTIKSLADDCPRTKFNKTYLENFTKRGTGLRKEQKTIYNKLTANMSFLEKLTTPPCQDVKAHITGAFNTSVGEWKKNLGKINALKTDVGKFISEYETFQKNALEESHGHHLMNLTHDWYGGAFCKDDSDALTELCTIKKNLEESYTSQKKSYDALSKITADPDALLWSVCFPTKL
jgi:hypothetical protein